jgi:hypothetical protein
MAEASGAFNPLTSQFQMYDNQGNLLPLGSRDTYIPRINRLHGWTNADKGTELILRAGNGNNIEPTAYQSGACQVTTV